MPNRLATSPDTAEGYAVSMQVLASRRWTKRALPLRDCSNQHRWEAPLKPLSPPDWLDQHDHGNGQRSRRRRWQYRWPAAAEPRDEAHQRYKGTAGDCACELEAAASYVLD